MQTTIVNPAKLRIIRSADQAFLTNGYSALSMADIADACGLTRRALYHHFSSKEDLFRSIIRIANLDATLRGDEAGRLALEKGATPSDVVTAWLDARFGVTRRRIGGSKHGAELNDVAFRLALDIIIEVSYETNHKLTNLVAELCRRQQLHMRPFVTPERIGRLIGDGARGVNQARPPVPNDRIRQRYYEIVDAILFGCAHHPADDKSVPSKG